MLHKHIHRDLNGLIQKYFDKNIINPGETENYNRCIFKPCFDESDEEYEEIPDGFDMFYYICDRENYNILRLIIEKSLEYDEEDLGEPLEADALSYAVNKDNIELFKFIIDEYGSDCIFSNIYKNLIQEIFILQRIEYLKIILEVSNENNDYLSYIYNYSCKNKEMKKLVLEHKIYHKFSFLTNLKKMKISK